MPPARSYVNVLPYDHNRVVLGPPETCPVQASVAATGGYVNASHITHSDPLGFAVQYIASQGPLPSTVGAFWQMCSEQGVGAVIMLTNTSERGATKCCPYFPAQPGARMALRGVACGGGSGEVSAVSGDELHCGDLTHRRLQLTLGDGAAGAPPLVVQHLQYHAWPDHSTPADSSPLRTMCDLLAPVRASGGGVVVHCSAGIGRTGTFIALDVLRLRLAALARRELAQRGSVSQQEVHAALDLPALVVELRQQRSGMVQTIEQYAFVYQALHEELAAGGPPLDLGKNLGCEPQQQQVLPQPSR